MQPQQPETQQPQTQTTQQIATAPIVANQPLTTPRTSKNSGGTLLIIYASLTLLLSIASFFQSLILAVIMLGLGTYWLIAGIKVLKSEPKQASKTLETASALVVGYAGVLLIASLFLPGFQISGALLPVIFAIVLAIMSVRVKKQVSSI